MCLPPVSTIDLAAEFPVLDELTYLNHAGVAPLPARCAAVMTECAQDAARGRFADNDWYHRVISVKSLCAKLVNARGRHEIAFIPNTTTGLATLAGGLDWRAGDRVVITDVEYPANRYPWTALKRKGVEVVEAKQGGDRRIDADDVIRLINDRTRVVALSHVQFGTGHRVDLKPIADEVHAAGGLLCVDAIQSVGVMPVDVRASGIDFLAADGHKWMLGPEGAGFLYCDEDLCQQLRPLIPGWLGKRNHLDYGSYDERDYPDARRFEPGTWNIYGVRALGASLELLLEVGMDVVWSRVDALCQHLRTRLDEKGYTVATPPGPRERSGIVSFETPEGAPPNADIVKQLGERGVVIADRMGRLRISPHFYNSIEQVDAAVDALP
jgi:selenocysteine lyase/cysteine desulfurase